MKLIIFAALIALSSAAQLPSKNYLPPATGFKQNGGYGSAGSGGAGGNGNTRAQQAVEKNAEILKLDQEVKEEGFHYNFETSNGIRVEESGDTEQSRGGFAYTGDDGTAYTVTFTAGVNGFQPQGAHLPVPPPIPQEILLGLELNAKHEAAGIFDDGLYHPEAEEGARGGTGSGGKTGSRQGFGSANRQGGFNANSGYSY